MKNDVNGADGSIWNAAGIFIGRMRIAFRVLWKNPLITSSAIISIALGIGASVAMFTIFDEYLLRRLPVPEPERLVNFSSPGPIPGSQFPTTAGGMDTIFSYPMFRNLVEAQQSFTSIAAHRRVDVNIAARGVGDIQTGMLVSGGYFPALALKPTLGRLLSPDDDKIIGEAHTVVLSYAYWQSRFGGDPGVLNQAVTVNGQPMTIVGVAPRGFNGTTLGCNPKIFIPITMRGGALHSLPNYPDIRTSYWLHIFGRLKPGVTLEQAAAAINVQYRNFLIEYDAPLNEQMIGADSPMMKQFLEKQLLLKPGARGQSLQFDSNKEWVNFFMGGMLLLLIIACINVANLLITRGMARTGEMALRVSFGATRWQNIQQLLIESFILVLIAGAAGILAAHWILRLIIAMFPAQTANIYSFSLNESSLLFAVLLTFAVGVSVGLFPAFHSAHSDITPLLKEQAGQMTGSKSAARLRMALVITQIALSLTLLAVSGLFAKSLYQINQIDIGMKTDNIVTFCVSPYQNGYTQQQTMQFFERLEEELAVLPGVNSVSNSQYRMFHGGSMGTSVDLDGFRRGPETDSITRMDKVGMNYFGTLGIPLIAGRDFTREDIYREAGGVIVNEAFAEKFKLGRDAVGKYVGFFGNSTNITLEIIGLAKNAKYASVEREPESFMFIPYRVDFIDARNLFFYVKTDMPEDSIIPQIRNLVSRMDPTLPIENLTTMAQEIRDNTFSNRFTFILAVSIAIFATLLTAVGLYGIFAYDVARRRREIGLRMALGATRLRICLMFLRKAALIALTGGAISIALSIFAGRIVQSMLYKFEGFAAGVFMGATALLFVIITQVVLIPVRRAVMTEPMEAIRDE